MNGNVLQQPVEGRPCLRRIRCARHRQHFDRIAADTAVTAAAALACRSRRNARQVVRVTVPGAAGRVANWKNTGPWRSEPGQRAGRPRQPKGTENKLTAASPGASVAKPALKKLSPNKACGATGRDGKRIQGPRSGIVSGSIAGTWPAPAWSPAGRRPDRV